LQPGADLAAVKKSMQEIAEQTSGGSFHSSDYGDIQNYRPFARSTATGDVARAIKLLADMTIWTMSLVPLLTLLIMSLAVVHVVSSSVRVRTWEFGVLRSIGISRWQLVRLVFAETVLIGFSASLLSLFFGVLAGWCGVAMANYSFWGGFIGRSAFLIPVKPVLLGFGIAMVLCLFSALWPAWRIGRSEPLVLLSSGRSNR